MKYIKFWQIDAASPKVPRVEISDDEYKTLSLARKKLVQILDMEILYDQIVEACVETKSAMYEMSLRNVSDSRIGDSIKGHNIRSKLNRLYFNVLNLSKLYLDKHFFESGQKPCDCDKQKKQSLKTQKSFVKAITGDDSLHSEVVVHRQAIYDANPDYRLGCALRNYVQHNTLPVETYTAGFKRHPDNQLQSSVFHIPLDKEKLAKRINKTLLSEYGKTIDLHSVVDGYVKAISEMHMLNRKLTEAASFESKCVIDGKVKEIIDEYAASVLGIEVIRKIGNSQSGFDLTTSWFDVVEHLQQKNRKTLDFRRFSHHPYRD